MLVNAKIKRFVSFGEYIDNTFVELFRDAGIEVDMMKKPSSTISYLE